MEKFYGFAKRLAEAFEAGGLDNAFTGALAVSYYGVPRTTSDIDVIFAVSVAKGGEGKILEALGCAGLDTENKHIAEALTSGYNISTFKDKGSAYTVDIIIQTEKVKKLKGKIAGLDTFFQVSEELIVPSLE